MLLAIFCGTYPDQERQVYHVEALVSTDTLTNNTQAAIAYERIITKIFLHYNIPLEKTPSIRATFRSKLWRMGKYWKYKACTAIGKYDSTWEFFVDKIEVNKQLNTDLSDLVVRNPMHIQFFKNIVEKCMITYLARCNTAVSAAHFSLCSLRYDNLYMIKLMSFVWHG